MSSVSISGLVSGVNVPSLVSSLSAAYQKPITQLQGQEAQQQFTLSAWGTLQSSLSSLQTTLSSLQQISTLNNRVAQFSNSALASASVSANAPLGTYNLSNVVQAQAQSLYSQDFSSSTNQTVGTGTLQIQVGSGTATSVTIDNTDNTLTGIAAAINNAGAGVSAAVVYDGTGYRLTLQSANTGTSNAFTVTASGATGSLAALSYSAATSASSSGMVESVVAQNASVTINGLPVTSSSNTVSGAIPGVTLNLLASSGSTQLTVTNDSTDFVTAVQAFVTSYNTAMGTINNLTSLNSTATSGGSGSPGPGPLIGDANLTQLRTQLLGVISSQGIGDTSGSSFTSLASVGINLDQDGTISLDTSALSGALSLDYNGVAGLFGQVGTASSANVQYGGATSSTQPGTYAVNISAAATQATVNAASPVPSGGSTSAETLTFTSGTTSVSVDLASGSTIDDMVNTINATLAQQGLGNIVAYDNNGSLQLQTAAYGSAQSFSVDSDLASGGSGLGTTTQVATGTDVAGTINGQAASGTGQSLTVTGGGAALGLTVNVTGQATGSQGSITVTEGIYQQMGAIVNQALNASTGFVASQEAGINSVVSGYATQITSLQTYAAAQTALLQQEFDTMQVQVQKLQSVGQYLTALFNTTSGSG
jgi:flagellar hook-associated protein 2